MSNVEISESAHLKNIQDNEDIEIGETYEDRGYSKIPIDQINLNTEPITISSDYSRSIFDVNIKSYIKVLLGFIVFIIILFMISILSGHFHYENVENNEKENIKNENEINNINIKQDKALNETFINNNNTLKDNIKKYR